jgi:HEPN domain-containing protein
MSAESLIASLLRIAREDLEGAKLLANQNRNSIYLCEQAAEKLIRAILTSEQRYAGIGHNLIAMVDLIPEKNSLKSILRELETLTVFATSYRYPTSHGRIPAAPNADKLAFFLRKQKKQFVWQESILELISHKIVQQRMPLQ